MELSTRKHVFAALAVAWLSWPVRAEFSFDAASNRWDLSNGVIHAVFEFGADGRFLFKQIDHLQNGVIWKASDREPSSPIRMRFDTTTYDAGTSFRLLDQHVETPNAKTSRQVIVLEDLQSTLQFKLEIEMYDGQPVLRQRVTVTNLRPQKVIARVADLLPYNFAANQQTHRLWRVNQWSVTPRSENFEASAVTLNPNGGAASMLTGAGGLYCGWLALRNPELGGLFAGWEFDGQAQATVQQIGLDDTVKLGVSISSLYHPVEGGATFQLPAAFLGIYQGDWDEAGFRTQNFTEAILATPAPAGFPYVSWDSWGYETEINDKILRENARIAAGLGIELFVIDLGWARQIGDWRADPQKFPRGLRSLSNYVHSLGMKFGLHFALAEAMQDSPVLQNHPGWASSGSYNYFGSRSLCLSNKPAQEWIIKQALNMIDNYGVDWIIQDGQNMVKHCTRSSHTHDPHDSNYANAVDGINAVVTAIRQQRPNTVWENCENGGNMMTFNMVQSYITSVTNDASGALGTRQGTYGATYPFSTRFADRYMPENPDNTYITRSYLFGGPWHFMNRLPEMSPEATELARKEIQIYKQIRAHIKDGKVYHVTPPPLSGRTDAIQSYSEADDTAIAIVVRDGSDADYADIKLQGLRPNQTYRVRFEDDARTLTMTGEQIARQGVRVNLPAAQIGEIIYVSPLRAQ